LAVLENVKGSLVTVSTEMEWLGVYHVEPAAPGVLLVIVTTSFSSPIMQSENFILRLNTSVSGFMRKLYIFLEKYFRKFTTRTF
jgi:hypothetical protein